MSTHPNAILMVEFIPDALARKTYRAILDDLGETDYDDPYYDDDPYYVDIGGDKYHAQVMEEEYDEDMQISAQEGSIVFWNYVTYGYGECISWGELEAQKNSLEDWAKGVCTRHFCSYKIWITANYE